MATQNKKPIIGIVIGDPAGVGPEVVAAALATGRVHESCIPVLIGSAAAMERAVKAVGVMTKINAMSSLQSLSDDPNVMDIIDTGAIAAADLPFAEDTKRGGEATAYWLDEMDKLAIDGEIDGTVLAPISTGSLKMANMLHKVISPTLGENYLVLQTGALRVAHLTDHLPLREVCKVISSDMVFRAIKQINISMKSWGIEHPRIAVSGLNPHAMGEEEQNEIEPGVRLALAQGIDVVGPLSPDAVFRQCIEGQYDIVLAMYHDQGHIAVKTWGFSGNSVIVIGPPYLHMSVAHGTAYDIVGQGIADSSMMLNAMRTAGFLASGVGFPAENKE